MLARYAETGQYYLSRGAAMTWKSQVLLGHPSGNCKITIEAPNQTLADHLAFAIRDRFSPDKTQSLDEIVKKVLNKRQ